MNRDTNAPLRAGDPAARQIERLRTVYQLTNAVSRAGGLPEIYEAALQGLEGGLSSDRASILLFDPDGVMRFKAWRGLSDGYRAAVEGHSPWTRDAVDPEPIVVPDVHADPAWEAYQQVFDAEGIRALGFIPLVSRGRLIGKFMVYFTRPHAFDEEEVCLAQTIAGHVAFAVDRRRDEEKLTLYREIFAHSTEAIAILDTAGTYVEQNEAHRALTGYADGELAGRTPSIHIGDEQFAEVARALQRDGIYRDDVTSTARSGAQKIIELSAFAVRDDGGEPVCYVGIKHDVTERKRMEEALQFLAGASEALDRSLDYDETVRALAGLTVPYLGDWVLIETLDDRGARLGTVSAHADPSRTAALHRLAAHRHESGTAPSPGSGEGARRLSSVSELLGDPGDAAAMALLGEVGAISAITAPLRARGRLLGVMTLVSTRGEYGDPQIALAGDLGRRAATALDNARLYREAQESDRRKEEFLAVLAHELRNPLMPLLTCLELMRSDMGDARPKDARREIMERQVRNLKRLVDDLLDVSRVTRGKIRLQKQPVPLATVVARAVETTRPWIEAHALHLSVTVDPTVRLHADSLRIEQVLANLLSNAAKYTAPGGHVEVSGLREGESVVLRVKDDGAGIDGEMLPRVFDLFVQGARSLGGLGVGLTLARTLVEMHGGSVEAHSEGPGLGSEFIVRLPAGAVRETREVLASAEGRWSTRPLRILVVDDNEDAANVLAEALRLRGHVVSVTHDGKSALVEARRSAPEVVLLDLGLPDLDGYDLATRFREETGLTGTRIVALSGYGEEQFRDRSAAAGLFEHLVKPVDLDQLDRVLAAAGSAEGAAGAEARTPLESRRGVSEPAA